MKPSCSLFLVTIAACGPSEDRFAHNYAESFCNAVSTCSDTQAALYGTPEECRETVNTLITAAAEAALSVENCNYNSTNAADCLDAMDGITCAHLDNVGVCGNIYTGDGCSEADSTL